MSNGLNTSRREFLGHIAAGAGTALVLGGCGGASSTGPSRPTDRTGTTAPGRPADPGPVTDTRRLTGVDRDPSRRWHVAGTDLGIPYVIDDHTVGFLFGDTFDTATQDGPPLASDWRSPVLLRSGSRPGDPEGIVFDSAAGVHGDGRAPEIMVNGHLGVGIDGVWEFSVIPNDAVTLPGTGRQVVSYMSIQNWDVVEPAGPRWRTNYAGLAYSDDGNSFTRSSVQWPNDEANTDPFQMWSMQRVGDWVYVITVRAGRQDGPMMLQRVRVERMLDRDAYEGWGRSGSTWSWGRPCTPILEGRFGEPSMRRLSDGTWAMSYLNCATGDIVTRTSDGPNRTWSDEKVQVAPDVTSPHPYGGFIHPWSSSKVDGLCLMVSRLLRNESGATTAYDVSQHVGTL